MSIATRWFSTMRHLKACFFFVLLMGNLIMQDASARQLESVPTALGRNGYVEYWEGNMPLVISAPHGGHLIPAEIDDRTSGTTVTDSNTKETALAFREAIFKRTGHHPYVVISNLKRTKLDPNREIIEAAESNIWAEQAWTEYHGFIESAKSEITLSFGSGLYVDLHGHGHSIQRLELGYLLSSNELVLSDDQLNSGNLVESSSIRTLVSSTSFSFSELLRGQNSLGTLFSSSGIPATPSLSQPNPGQGNPFFSGGYSTRRHGSADGGRISGVQIEAYYAGLRNSSSNRAFFAEKAALVFQTFLRETYNWDSMSTGMQIAVLPEFFHLRTSAYPNPFSKRVSLTFSATSLSPFHLKIVDALGRLVQEKVVPHSFGLKTIIPMDTHRWSSGVYTYQIRSQTHLGYGLIVKQ